MREQKSAFPRVVITSWWDNISNDVLPKIFDEVEFAGWELEHAAIVETSAMMYFTPELVNEELFLDEGLEICLAAILFPFDPVCCLTLAIFTRPVRVLPKKEG